MKRLNKHFRSRSSTLSSVLVKVVIGFILCYGLIVAFRSLQQSSFFDRKDRINIVFYGEHPVILSLGLADSVNYTVDFNNSHQVIVPGGYGRYSVGALGKLAQIEEEYSIIQRSFSSMISAHVDYYSVPTNNEVYDAEGVYFYNKFDLINRILSPKFKTNISFFEKIYISYLILAKREADMISIEGTADYNSRLDTYAFSESGFLKKYRGFFYHGSLREEGSEVKILYTNTYSAAVNSARVIEGQGIRISDIGRRTDDYEGEDGSEKAEKPFYCILHYGEASKELRTVRYLHDRFNCKTVQEQPEGADILLVIGEKFESQWE